MIPLVIPLFHEITPPPCNTKLFFEVIQNLLTTVRRCNELLTQVCMFLEVMCLNSNVGQISERADRCQYNEGAL